MAQFRNVSADARTVVYGVALPVEVEVDGLVVVDDTVAESYACQTTIWKLVDGASAAPAPAAAPLATPTVQAEPPAA